MKVSPSRNCLYCKEPIPVGERADKIYCSRACKDRALEATPNSETASKMLKEFFKTEEKGVKSVKTSCGREVLVDANLHSWLSRYTWTFNRSRGYACHKGMAMHYLLKNLWGWPDQACDHKDRNKLNNTKENLRPASISQNNANKGPFNKTSGYKGVHRNNAGNWQAMVWYRGRNQNIGSFGSAEEAARAYDRKARELFGEFAYQNFDQVS